MQRHFRETRHLSRHAMNPTADASNITERRALRRRFRSLRSALSPRAQKHHADAVLRHLLHSNLLLRRGSVAAYLTNHAEGELDCRPLIRQFWRMGRTVVLPAVGRTRGFMALYRYDPTTRLVVNRYGIAEPAADTDSVSLMTLSMVLLPLVAFDDDGGRLGMGGGYYDRFLGARPALLRPRLVGLAHEIQRSSTPLPCEPWDIPLDDIVTEAGWRHLGSARC